jgi:hypothetical protein
MRSGVAVVLAALVSACSSGGGDLNELYVRPQTLGNPIAKAAAPESRLPDGETLRARGVVVIAVDTYDDSKDGRGVGDVFVQDPVQTGPKGTPWSGLRLFRPTREPADLVLVPGQGVDLVGDFQTFAGPPANPFPEGLAVPQAAFATLKLTYEGRAPEPIDLAIEDLDDPQLALQYASRLVRFKNVPIVGGFGGSRPEAAIYTPDRRFVLAAKFFPIHETAGLVVAPGTTLKSVTGVLDYFYNFKLCPRSIADVEP